MKFFALIGEIAKLNWRLFIEFWWVWLLLLGFLVFVAWLFQCPWEGGKKK